MEYHKINGFGVRIPDGISFKDDLGGMQLLLQNGKVKRELVGGKTAENILAQIVTLLAPSKVLDPDVVGWGDFIKRRFSKESIKQAEALREAGIEVERLGGSDIPLAQREALAKKATAEKAAEIAESVEEIKAIESGVTKPEVITQAAPADVDAFTEKELCAGTFALVKPKAGCPLSGCRIVILDMVGKLEARVREIWKYTGRDSGDGLEAVIDLDRLVRYLPVDQRAGNMLNFDEGEEVSVLDDDGSISEGFKYVRYAGAGTVAVEDPEDGCETAVRASRVRAATGSCEKVNFEKYPESDDLAYVADGQFIGCVAVIKVGSDEDTDDPDTYFEPEIPGAGGGRMVVSDDMKEHLYCVE